MAGLASNPMFQRAMLKKRAQAMGSGSGYNTADITGQFAGQMEGRRLQFEDIESQKRRVLKSISQRGQLMGVDRKRVNLANKRLQDEMDTLPLTVGLGMGTSVLAGLEGRRRSQIIAAANRRQMEWQNNIMNQIAYKKQGKLRGGR